MSNTKFGSTLNFMYFGHNFPYDFIYKVWGGTYGQKEPCLSKHLNDKFSAFFKDYGTMTFFRWFMELDDTNKKKLFDWVEANYVGRSGY